MDAADVSNSSGNIRLDERAGIGISNHPEEQTAEKLEVILSQRVQPLGLCGLVIQVFAFSP
jgi:hypothetical protein